MHPETASLSARDRAILDFERTWWTEPGAKEARIRAELQMSPSRYRQLLGAVVDGDAAVAYDPLTVKRLRKERERRRRARIEGPRADPRTR